MYDAMGVRYETGKQAEILNILVKGNKTFKEKTILLKEKVGQEKADLYSEVSYKMYRTTQEFFREGPKTSNPIEKAKLYEKMDYSEVNKYIEDQTTKEK